MDGGQKTSDRVNYKGQLVLTLNDGASRTVSKRTVELSLHRMGFGSHRPTRVPLLNAQHQAAHLAWARELRDWSVEDWKRVAWSDESRFRLSAGGSLRIGR
ncbi:HTH_Tnp_Tc3_2 domain-containing protein [Trichonephila clavipes]|nr:HTH_Tnp_Tc3_2 domain-containing protein [Trichonephila clavipes]